MNMQHSSINQLLIAWKRAHAEESGSENYLRSNIPQNAFIPDGIICQEKYDAATRKILFIAKEANWYSCDATLSGNETGEAYFWHQAVAFGDARAPRTMFSNRIAMLANAMLHDNYEYIDKNDYTGLQTVAFMNLNKRGGYAYCDWMQLNGYVNVYHTWISREIELIAPDIIVCCGDSVKWLLKAYNISIPSKTKLISVYHPSYFVLSDADYLKQIACAMNGKQWNPTRVNSRNDKTEVPIKGIIFDTNKTYSENATFEMLTSEKVSAYEEASRFVYSFNIGDYAFFYIAGKGIVAAGIIVSDAATTEFEGAKEAYRMLKMVVPINVPTDEKKLKAIEPAEIKALCKHGFFFAATTKRPYLNYEECQLLVARLKALYKVNNV